MTVRPESVDRRYPVTTTNAWPSIYRPSARVVFRARLEEYTDTDPLLRQAADGLGVSTAPAAPSAPVGRAQLQEQVAQVQAQLRQLGRIRSQAPPDAWARRYADLQRQRALLQAQLASPATQGPPVVSAASPDDRTIVISAIPVSGQIERNGPKQADTAEFVCNYIDLPIDPRMMRGMAVEFTIGVVDPLAFEDGVRGATDAQGRLRSQVGTAAPVDSPDPGGRESPGPRLPNTTRFVGIVTDANLTMDETDPSSWKIECQDFTALLFNQPLADGDSIDLSLPIDQGVRALINRYPLPIDFSVRLMGAIAAPVPVQWMSTRLMPRRGRRPRRPRRASQNAMSLWEHITDVCQEMALTPYVSDYELRIADRHYFAGDTQQPRRMVYGRNLSHLEFTRKTSGVKVTTVQMRSYDPTIGKVRWVQYPGPNNGTALSGIIGVTNPPTRPQNVNTPGVSGATVDEQVQVSIAYQVTSEAQLERAARNFYEGIGRQEIEGNFSTSDVSSFEPEGDVGVADLLDLDSGDPMELLTVGEPRSRAVGAAGALTIGEIARMDVDARTQYLVNLGWTRELANRLAIAYEADAFQTVFHVQNVRISWDTDEGIAIAADFINFVEGRDKEEHPPASTGPIVLTETPGGVITGNPGAIQLDPFVFNEPEMVSPRIAQATEGQDSPTSRALRQASSQRNQLAAARAAGRVPADDYSQQAANLDAYMRQLIAQQRGGGA